jgi:secondary thiamine-phosphate synthase enzyme
MFLHQAIVRLRPRPRGFHLVTTEVLACVPELAQVRVGFLGLFLQHTSASLTIQENADPDVRADLERWCNHVVPEGAPYFKHVTEGGDDMPAHVKAAMFGQSLTIPVRDGRPLLGTWQGIYLGEHRDDGGARSAVVTVWGLANDGGSVPSSGR